MRSFFFGIFQLLPIRVLAHPIWSSAATALNTPLAGTITVDKAATEQSLLQILVVGAMALISSVMGQERATSSRALATLTAVSVVVAGLSLLTLTDVRLLADRLTGCLLRDAVSEDAAAGFAYLGLILGLAGCDLELERAARRQFAFRRPVLLAAAAFGVTAVTCGVAILLTKNPGLLIASGIGAMNLGLIRGSRVLHASARLMAVLIVLLVITASVVALEFRSNQAPIALAFALGGSERSEMVTRMIADAPIFGTGFGSFDDLVPLYQVAGASPGKGHGSTAAATLVIEMGLWPTLGVLFGSVVGLASLVWGALHRGRDVAFSAMGAAVVAGAPILACSDASLSLPAVQLAAAALLGIALTQRRGRTSDAATIT